MTYQIRLKPSDASFHSENNLLDDAISQSIHLEHSCKTGDCGTCSAELISGSIQNENGDILTEGCFLTCQSQALSDVIIKANYYPELTLIKQQTVPCKVAKVEYLTDDIVVLNFRFPPTVKFDYIPGQYVDLSFNGIKRSYSIANAKKEDKSIELHIRKVPNGKMSDMIFGKININQLLRIEGPKGTFFLRNNNKPLILLATGTGIAPIKAIVEELIQSEEKRDVYIYWGMRFNNEIYCQELIKLASEFSHIHFYPVLSKEKNYQGLKGYVQDSVCERFDCLSDYEVYACGSLNMINDARKKFEKRQLLSDAFYSDAFTPAK